MIRSCREDSDAPDGYAFPVKLAKLEAVQAALREDWATAFQEPTAIEALVREWTLAFEAASRDHRTEVAAEEFDRVVGVLLKWLPSARLRAMFSREIELNLGRVPTAVVRAPTHTWLSASEAAKRYDVRGAEAIRDTIAESILIELAGEPVDLSRLDAQAIPLDMGWLVDGVEATADEVRALPEADASRVTHLMNGEPVEPWIFSDRIVPFREIDEALHMAVGPFVPSLGEPSAELVARGRPVLDTTWPTNALMRSLGVKLEWTFFAPDDQALVGKETGSTAAAIRDQLRKGQAVLCCRDEPWDEEEEAADD